MIEAALALVTIAILWGVWGIVSQLRNIEIAIREQNSEFIGMRRELIGLRTHLAAIDAKR
jgi:hypothetical protein